MEKMLTETKKKIEKTRKDILNWGDKHSKCTDKHNVMLGIRKSQKKKEKNY